jgi:hypothetical protein
MAIAADEATATRRRQRPDGVLERSVFASVRLTSAFSARAW